MQAPSHTQTEVDSKDRFFRYFRHEVTALQEQMERLASLATGGGERSDAVDHCLAGIDRLSHEVKDASSYIPAYDQRTYSEAIKALSEKLQSIRQTFNPPKKFAFKTRKNASAISISDAAELAASQRLRAPIVTSDTSNTNSSFAPTPLDRLSPGERKEQEAALHTTSTPTPASTSTNDGISDTANGIQRPIFPNQSSMHIRNHTGRKIQVPSSAAHATSSGTLSNLSTCTVDLSPASTTSPFHTLYLKNLTACSIISGPVSGATHITSVRDSTLYLATRQFRMHGARNVDVYLQCGSRPIIEDCVGVRFAPLPVGLGGVEWEDGTMWDQVDDFGWLRVEQSPNWGVLPEAERVVPEKLEG